LITVLVLVLGLRPALKAIISDKQLDEASGATAIADMSGMNDANMRAAGVPPGNAALSDRGMAQLGDLRSDPMYDNLAREVSNSPRDRLAKIVELDPDRAVEVMKQWLGEPSGHTA
jgi:flagellar biosynthesis/type III secretory pathway M-ring protein FliF/YscJ